MNGNPFYVKPGGDATQGLTGLSSVLGVIAEQKQASDVRQEQYDREDKLRQDAIDRAEKIRQGAKTAYESGNVDTMISYAVAHPEMSQALKMATKFKNDATEQNYKESSFEFMLNPTEENAQDLVTKRKALLQTHGADDTALTDSFMDKFNADPKSAVKDVRSTLSFMFPKEMKEYRDAQLSSAGNSALLREYGAWKQEGNEGGILDFVKKKKEAETLSDPWKNVTGAYKNFLISNQMEPSKEAYSDWQENTQKAKRELTSKTYPYLADLMSEGWVPSTRITKPMMEAYESAAARAAEKGSPLKPQDLYDMEFNAVKNRATGRSAGSRLVLQRKQNIESAKGLLEDMRKTSKKLNYPDVNFLGVIEKWKNGQLNDPIFTEYMTQRSDALFVLGNALKQNGLTDKSIEVEEEAARPTMSPGAFKAWYNTQLRALNRATEELNEDYKYGIDQVDTVEAGQGGVGKPTKPGYREGQTATGPNGEKIIFKNGSWEPM